MKKYCILFLLFGLCVQSHAGRNSVFMSITLPYHKTIEIIKSIDESRGSTNNSTEIAEEMYEVAVLCYFEKDLIKNNLLWKTACRSVAKFFQVIPSSYGLKDNFDHVANTIIEQYPDDEKSIWETIG
jgi:hypothetical protein